MEATTVCFEVVGDALVARFLGSFSPELNLPLFRSALDRSREAGIRRVLCDLSGQSGEPGYLGRLRLGEAVSEFWDPETRLAVVGRPDQLHPERAGTRAAAARGLRVGAFADFDEGFAWLASDDAAPNLPPVGVELETTRYQLNERIKELATLYRLTTILQANGPLPKLLRDIAGVLPQGWQFVDHCVGRIEFDGQTHDGEGYTPTQWSLSSDFRLADGRTGRITVGYLREFPAAHEGPFLREERELIEMSADILRTHLDGRAAQEKAERRFRRLGALRAIDLAILSNLDLRVTQRIVLDHAVGELDADAATILLFDEGGNRLEYFAGRGFAGEGVRAGRFRLGEALPGKVAAERKTIFANLRDGGDASARRPGVEAEDFTWYAATPLIAAGRIEGIMEVFSRTAREPSGEWIEFCESLAGQAAIAVANTEMFHDLQRANTELSIAYDATLEGWTRALDLRDKETEGHTARVTELTERLARHMGLPEAEIVHARRGALLHDIGKLGVPDSILLKPGPLTEDEWKVMRMHPVYAHEWLSSIAYLKPALAIPYAHHEKWDGSGYPRGLRSEDIPQPARMFAVIDVYDALISDRPYRKGWPKPKVLEHIREQRGKHFDPRVADAFLELMG